MVKLTQSQKNKQKAFREIGIDISDELARSKKFNNEFTTNNIKLVKQSLDRGFNNRYNDVVKRLNKATPVSIPKGTAYRATSEGISQRAQRELNEYYRTRNRNRHMTETASRNRFANQINKVASGKTNTISKEDYIVRGLAEEHKRAIMKHNDEARSLRQQLIGARIRQDTVSARVLELQLEEVERNRPVFTHDQSRIDILGEKFDSLQAINDDSEEESNEVVISRNESRLGELEAALEAMDYGTPDQNREAKTQLKNMLRELYGKPKAIAMAYEDHMSTSEDALFTPTEDYGSSGDRKNNNAMARDILAMEAYVKVAITEQAVRVTLKSKIPQAAKVVNSSIGGKVKMAKGALSTAKGSPFVKNLDNKIANIKRPTGKGRGFTPRSHR